MADELRFRRLRGARRRENLDAPVCRLPERAARLGAKPLR
jgi:hypothetical protein